MTDSTSTNNEPEMGSSSDDSFAWTEPEKEQAGAGQQAREWLTQLQAMIENLATQAAPVVREVGIKAAELAAKAGEKAGPVAQRAAELTGQAGTKLASKSRDLAADLRRDADAAKASTIGAIDEAEGTVESIAETASAEVSTADEPTTTGVA
jgi:hypothetical protein